MRCHVTAVRLGSLPQVDFDTQRVTAVHRTVVVDPLSERMSKMLQRARVGNGRSRHHERQHHQDHTCDPNLHTNPPEESAAGTVAALGGSENGLNEVFGESLRASLFVKN
jgi:hypothetical protein